MGGLKTQIFNKLESVLMRISSKRSKFRQWYIKQKDDALGREVVGIDKFGNKYYQYYSYHGLPTKRLVLYKFLDANKFQIDPHFQDWLYKRDLLAPTPEQLEQLYLEHDAFIERGIEWDREQIRMIEEHKSKMKELGQTFDEEEKLIEEGKKLEQQKWIPDLKKAQESKQLQQISQIDKMEHEYFLEYQRIIKKDESQGKDFNKLVYDEAKKAKYYFEYLRTQEQLYNYEQEQQKLQEQLQQEPQEVKQTQASTHQQHLENIMNLDSIKRTDDKLKKKQSELQSNRYKEFREEFEDVFEQTLARKSNKEQI